MFVLLGVVLAAAAAMSVDPPHSDVLGWLVALAAGLTALGYLFRQAQRAFRFLEQIHDLTSRELEHTGNPDDDSTMKDDLHGIAVSLGRLQRRVDKAVPIIEHNSARLDAVEADLRPLLDPLGRNLQRRRLDDGPHQRRDDD